MESPVRRRAATLSALFLVLVLVLLWGMAISWVPEQDQDQHQDQETLVARVEEVSASIPNNIAEGNGKWSKRNRKRYFEIARGSALECASCLDVLVPRRRIDQPQIAPGKEKLHSVVNMLTRIIKNLSSDGPYASRSSSSSPFLRMILQIPEQDQDQEQETGELRLSV